MLFTFRMGYYTIDKHADKINICSQPNYAPAELQVPFLRRNFEKYRGPGIAFLTIIFILVVYKNKDLELLIRRFIYLQKNLIFQSLQVRSLRCYIYPCTSISRQIEPLTGLQKVIGGLNACVQSPKTGGKCLTTGS